jgi:DNA-binding SARP family transcriptional activator
VEVAEAEAAMEFRILGPVDVLNDAGERLIIGGARERGLLALLLLSANQVVSTERLVEGLWGEQRTGGAVHALRVHVSRLRRALRDAGRDELLLTRPHGYLLRVEPDAIDAARFDALLSTARQQAAQNDPAGAADTLREALAQWRGPALADVLDAPFVRSQAARLEETRLGALEQRIDHDLACGRHTELVAELAELTTTSPLRERLWSARMLALYRSGRQADALSTYQNLRNLLHDELGLEPSSALVGLHTAILNQHPQLDWSPPPPDQHPTPTTPAPKAAPPGEGGRHPPFRYQRANPRGPGTPRPTVSTSPTRSWARDPSTWSWCPGSCPTSTCTGTTRVGGRSSTGSPRFAD